MNILLIQTDQQRRDCLGAYGNEIVRTPNIDRLSAEGVTFEDAYTPIPISGPARASMLTGKFASRHGVLRNKESGEPGGMDLHPGTQTFGTLLRDAGCSAHHVGKWHVGKELTPAECGFDGVFYPGYGFPARHPHYLKYLESLGVSGFNLRDETFPPGRETHGGFMLTATQEGPEEAAVPHYLAANTVEAIEGARGNSQPFFARMDFWGPHAPYILPERHAGMYDPAEMPRWPNLDDPLKNKPRIQSLMKDYWGLNEFTWDDPWARIVAACYGYATLIDDAVGVVLDYLEKSGLLEETAILFTSDHGGMVGAHGMFDKGPYMYDEICRVPLIARIPGVAGGRRIDGPVYNMDLMPTSLELAGAKIPDDIDAQSLLPAIRGDDNWQPRDAAYLEFFGHQCSYAIRVLRTDAWKYVFNGPDTDELYNLKADPGELTNRISDPDAKLILEELRARMGKQIKDLGDPAYLYYASTRLGKP